METMSQEIAGGLPVANKPETAVAGIRPRASLFDIETNLADLLALRMEMEVENEDTSAVDAELDTVIRAEVMKVDGIRAVVRALKAAMEAAKQERDYQAKRAQSAEAMIARIKAFAQSAMEASGKKRIEGRTGYLSLKGNGGVQPLEIADPSLIPDDVCVWQLTLSNEDYQQALVYLQAHGWEWENHPDSTVVRALNNMAIRAALAEPCPVCGPMENQGEAPGGACPACGGSGRNAVPGARLLERGQHVEVR